MRSVNHAIRLMSILFLLSGLVSGRNVQAAHTSNHQNVTNDSTSVETTSTCSTDDCCKDCDCCDEHCDCCTDGKCTCCTEGSCKPGCCENCECCKAGCCDNGKSLAIKNEAALDMIMDSSEYLGCAVDEQQCASRATNHGYSTYHAEKSYLCANAAKYACWGSN